MWESRKLHNEVSHTAFFMKYDKVNEIKETSEGLIRPVTLIEEMQNAYKHLIKESKAKKVKRGH